MPNSLMPLKHPLNTSEEHEVVSEGRHQASYLAFGFPRFLRTRANSSLRCSGVSLSHRIRASPAANEFLGAAFFLGPQRASAAAL